MVAKKTKKFIVVLVLLIAWFSLIFWSMIMLLWWNQVVVTDQTEKTWNTTEETDVFKEMSKKIKEQEKEWALALTWHNNVYKEDEQIQNKLQELNVSLEKLDDQEQTNQTKLNKEEIIEKFNQSTLVKKYNIDTEQLYYFLYDLDWLNLEVKEIRALWKKFEDMQKDPEYENDFKKIRNSI